MKIVLFVLLIFLIPGCASLEPQIKSWENQYIIFREKYKDGVVLYKSENPNPINFLSFNIKDSGQIEMLIKRSNLSFVYDLGICYSGTVYTETKIAKIELKMILEDFLSIITFKERK